jgi:hypothetical protein
LAVGACEDGADVYLTTAHCTIYRVYLSIGRRPQCGRIARRIAFLRGHFPIFGGRIGRAYLNMASSLSRAPSQTNSFVAAFISTAAGLIEFSSCWRIVASPLLRCGFFSKLQSFSDCAKLLLCLGVCVTESVPPCVERGREEARIIRIEVARRSSARHPLSQGQTNEIEPRLCLGLMDCI